DEHVELERRQIAQHAARRDQVLGRDIDGRHVYAVTDFIRGAGHGRLQNLDDGGRFHGLGAGPFDLLLQLNDAVNQRLRARRAPGDEDVHWNNLIDALDDGVVIEN